MEWEKKAIHEFVRYGYEQVEVTGLGEKCCSDPAFFHDKFKDKYHLFQHLMEISFSMLAERLDLVFSQPEDPVQRLQRLMISFGEFGMEHPDEYQIAMMVRPNDESQHIPVESAVRVRSLFRKALRQAIKGGYVRNDVPLEQAVQGVMCVIHGVVSSLLVLQRINMAEPNRLFQYVTSNYLAGMLLATRKEEQ